MKYNPNHSWGEDDYYGFSFDAGVKLGHKHDYALVHQVNTTNLYFVRKDLVNWQNDFGVTYNSSKYHKHTPNKEWIEV